MYSHNFKKVCRDIITEGKKRFNLETGIVSKIQDNQYEIVSIQSLTNVFVAGESFDLTNTICSQVARMKETFALNNFQKDSQQLCHPLYVPLSLKSYIGSPIFLNENIWGTLNFTSFSARIQSFTIEEIRFIENCASIITAMLRDEPEVYAHSAIG